jgi:hypothetical protein
MTAQLPDVLAFMFTANAQSLEGCANIARRAMEARRKLPVNRPALLPLPIPARFEQREEYERAQQWRTRFASDLAPFFDRWRPVSADPVKLIDQLTIPYVPRWTFGEDLSALQEPAGPAGTRTASHAVSFALETIAALLAQGFAKIDLLVSSRDEYVHAARASIKGRQAASLKSAKVFCSFPGGDIPVMDAIVNTLSTAGFNPLSIEKQDIGSDVSAATTTAIEGADAYLIVMGPTQSQWQAVEIAAILRQTLRSDQRKPIIPVVLPGGEKTFYSSRLADFQVLELDPAQGSVAQQLSPMIERLKPLLEGKTELFAA